MIWIGNAPNALLLVALSLSFLPSVHIPFYSSATPPYFPHNLVAHMQALWVLTPSQHQQQEAGKVKKHWYISPTIPHRRSAFISPYHFRHA